MSEEKIQEDFARIKISDAEMEKINLKRDDFKGKWNYVINM